MKKKRSLKFKPLHLLYDHAPTLFDSKAVGLSKVSMEKSAIHQDSVEELSREKIVNSHRQLPSSEASTIPCTSCTSYSEEFQSQNHTKAPSHFEDLPIIHNETSSQTTDVFDCQGDNSSCISKEDGAVLISSDHFGGADNKNVSSSAPSVSSSCPDALEKLRAHKYADQVTLPTGGFSDQTETPSKDDSDGLDHKVGGKPCIFANTETGSSDEYLSATFLNNFDGIKGSKSDSPIASTQEQGNGSEELVDVRVCDICGDVGREALLAVCSKCSDGAEHIYCMSPKMEKVPESDWLCEECVLMREPKKPRQNVMERSDSDLALKQSCVKELSQGLRAKNSAVQHEDNLRIHHLGEASGLSDKRLGSRINVRSDIKKRTGARSVQPLKIGSGPKTRLSHVSSLMNMDEGKDAARQVSSFVDLPAKKVMKQTCSSGDRSPKSEQKFCGGYLNNGNSVKGSDSNMEVRRSRDTYHRGSAKENAYGELKKGGHPGKKVFQSLSSTGGGSSVSIKKNVRCKRGRNSNETHSSVVRKANQVAGFSTVKVSSSRTKVSSKDYKAANSSKKNMVDNKAIQVNENTHDEVPGPSTNKVLGFMEESKSPCHQNYMVNSPAENANAYGDQRMNIKNTEVDDVAKDKHDNSVAPCKNLCDLKQEKVMPEPVPEDIDPVVPFATSAIPESRCIWKGKFRVKKSRELPIDCYGVQAHLSTSASSKAAELVHKFSSEMVLEEVPRSHFWPIQFQKNHPTEQDIALYFFAQDLRSYGKSYRMLVGNLSDSDLALVANFGDFDVLVFPSSLLPARSQCWNSLPYLWGVFKARKVDDCIRYSSGYIATENQGLYSPVMCGSERKSIPTPVIGSALASCASHNSMRGSESVSPVVLQSSALAKSGDKSLDLLEKNVGILQKDVQTDAVIFTHAWGKEGSGESLHSYDLQKQKRLFDEDTESINKTDIIGADLMEHIASIGPWADGIYKGPNVTQVYESASDLWQRHDVASGSSFSIDSGPSGSSDCVGGAKSAGEPQVEPLRSYNDLNLDLCLGSRSGSDAVVDLDLSLGLPNNVYQPKNSFENGSFPDKDVSLVLSLGMPCSTR